MSEDKNNKTPSIFGKFFKKKGDKNKAKNKTEKKESTPAKKAMGKDCPCDRKPPKKTQGE